MCLNPYCSGRWSRTKKQMIADFLYCLNPYCSGRWSRTKKQMIADFLYCLNPYCSGRWSRTLKLLIILLLIFKVLILIVVEDGLVQRFVTWFNY